ncbi:MAG: hypothetical protein JWO13_247 [Acidobacteriales bacterium]|nr:hypothetical protein [Terriglobales bacterium]
MSHCSKAFQRRMNFALIFCCILTSECLLAQRDEVTGTAPLLVSDASLIEFPRVPPLVAPTISPDHAGSPAIERVPESRPSESFQWTPALRQSATLLAFQQGMMLGTDKWARYNLMHGRFFHDYFSSIKGVTHWDDGDPVLDNYLGHPLQGAVSGYIQVQNDPKGRRLKFGKTSQYWKSRLKAMAWNAAYSTQFEIGPLSEASIENLGSYQYQNCESCKMTNGAGYVDLVVTPLGGFGWMLAEDAMDRYVVERLETKLKPGFWRNLVRATLNPARIGANALRMKAPWYRDNRPAQGE